VGIQFGDALSLHGLRPEFADLSAGTAGARRRRSLAGLDVVDAAAGRPAGFWALVRTPPEKRDMVQIQKDADAEAVQWRIIDARLATRRFMEGDAFTIADIALGAFARRWFGVEGITKPKLENLERWFALIAARPGFVRFIAPPMT